MITDDGVRLWVDERGTGVPLVFVHGGPGMWDYFGDVAAALAPYCRTIRWDQRGGGRSGGSGPYTIARFVKDLDVVRGGHERVAVLGHSWGAFLALRYAATFPRHVSHLVYVSGVGVDPEDTWKPAYRAALRDRIGDEAGGADEREQAIGQWTADYADPATALAHATRLATPWFAINHAGHAALGRDFTEHLARTSPGSYADLRVPTLIIDGAHDIRPRSAVDSLAAALPDVRRVTFPDAGHNPWAENPDEFTDTVRGFVTGQDSNSSR